MKILFASDISFKYLDGIGVTDYKAGGEKAFGKTAEVFRKADFSMVNLENIFGKKEELTPIIKSGPNLISSPEFIEYINVLRPTAVGLANNHLGDYGDKAMVDTMEVLKKNGYLFCGAGKNIEEAYRPVRFEKDGVKVAVFAVCENEFGTADTGRAGSAGYRLGLVTKSIKEAKAEGFLPVIYFHGGNEQDPIPSPGKAELYRHFIDLGAEAVIAMHTHCPQGNEYYNGKPIVYSMGNFFFPHGTGCEEAWYVGYMTLLDVSAKETTFDVIPYRFDDEKNTLLCGKEYDDFMQYLDYIKKPIADEALLREYFDSWCMDAGLGYASRLDFSELDTENGNAESARSMKNIFGCEAHNELVTNTLRIIFEERCRDAAKRLDEIKQLRHMKLPM